MSYNRGEMAQWWYAMSGERFGPVEEADLRAKLISVEVQPTDLVWTEGMADWKPAMEVFPAGPEAVPAPMEGGGAMPGPEGPAQAVPMASSPSGSPGPVEGAVDESVKGLSLAALISGIVGLSGFLCCVTFPGSIVAIVTGHLALSRLAEVESSPEKNQARIGLILGYVGIGLAVVFTLIGFGVGLLDGFLSEF